MQFGALTIEYLMLAVAALLLLVMLASIEVGRRLGRRWRRLHGDAATSGSATVEAAVLGLLGLTLAFSFSGASDRLAQRRAQIVDEANAIGTAWLRLDLLPQADQPMLRTLLRDYLDSRIAVYEQFADRERSLAALARGSRLQRQIWSAATASCARSTVAASCLLLLPALNDMFDIVTTRTMAQLTHLPPLIIGLLILLCCLGGLQSGYALSAQTQRDPVQTSIFALAIAATVFVVVDLEFPRGGLINLGQMDQAIVDLRATMRP